MFTELHWRKSFITSFLISAFLLSSLPLNAQDIVTSSDISGGSSVFVFRGNRKPKQTAAAFTTVAKRTTIQKRETRTKIVQQTTTVAKAIQKTRPTKRIDAAEFKRIEPELPRMSKDKASLVFAGAGEYYLERDDIDRGLDFFRESVNLDNTNKFALLGFSDASTRKGNELLEKEEFEKAKFYFEDAIKNDEKNATAYAGLAEAQDSTEESDKAVLNYEKALSINANLTELYTPLGIAYYEKGEINKAKNYLSKALASDPENSETQYFLGSILYKETNYKDALIVVQKAVKKDPDNAGTHYLLANIFDKQERETDAIAEYKKAVSINPKLKGAWFDLGAAQYNAENYAEAIIAYEVATKLDNRNWQAYLNLADSYWQAGQFGKAEGAYNLALVFIQKNNEVSNQEKAEIYNKFGWTLGQQCRVLMEQAKQCDKWVSMLDKFQKAVDLVPDAINYSNLGWAYFNQGHLDIVSRRDAAGREKLVKAKAALESAINLKPTFAEAPLMNLGGTLIDLGEYDAAIETLRKVSGKRGDWQTADYMIGVAYRKSGNFEKAADAFSSALKKDNNYVAALAGLGETQFRRNKKDETDKIIAQLRKIGTPDAILEARKLTAVMKMPF
ncbi:MAG: tetratricopeptide repeat protein [Pyrinomonadaceae bacterium]